MNAPKSKSKFDHWKRPNSRAFKKAQSELGMTPTRKPRVCYQHSELMRQICWKLLDKHARKGNDFGLTYEWIASDMHGLGRIITVRQVEDAVARLRKAGCIKTTRKHQRSKLVLFSIDIALLKAQHKMYDDLLAVHAPHKKPVDNHVDSEKCETLNVPHETLNVPQVDFKRATILKQYLKKDLKKNQDSRSSTFEDLFSQSLDKGVARMHKDRTNRQYAEYRAMKAKGW